MNKFAKAVCLAAVACLAAGCQTVHYRVNAEAVPVEALEHYKLDKADIPVAIQIVNFTINSVDASYPDEDKETFRRHNAVAIPNALQHSFGNRKAFSEVSRTVTADPKSADYIVSGTYDSGFAI